MSNRSQQRLQTRQGRKQTMDAIRAQQHGQAPSPPPSAGAVDLGSMKGGDRAKQQGFMCSCGERFRDQGIIAMGYNLGRFPEQGMVMTPKGPQVQTTVDDGAQFFSFAFCSRSCINYLDALKNGLDPGEEAREQGTIRPNVQAIRQLPTVEWIDEQQEEIAA